MKVLHVNAGLEKGGGLFHIVNLLKEAKLENKNFELLTLSFGPVTTAAREAGITTNILGAKNRYDLTVLKRLIDYINKNDFDVVHTHGARANLFLNMIHKKIKAKWVVTVHSDPLKDFSERGFIGDVFTKLNVHALKNADGIFAITQNFANLLVNQVKIPRTKICVIYNGIFFHNNDAIPSKYAHPYFNLINVARTEKIKGQDLLLKALKDTNNKNIHLHIVGDGEELSNLRALTRDLGIADQVIFHGFLSHQEINELYRKMDLAVLTSYSESFPLVLLEASDNLLPILSTDVGDIRKMIPDDQHGIVVEIGDQKGLAKKILQASNFNQQQLHDMALSEKEYVANTFSMENQLAAIENYYKILLGEN